MLQRNRAGRYHSEMERNFWLRTAVLVLLTVAALMLAAVAALSLGGGSDPALDVLTTFAPLVAVCLIGCGGTAYAIARRGSGWRAFLVLTTFAGLAAAGTLIVPEYLRPIPHVAPAPSRPVLRVLSFNVWRSNEAPAETIRAIAAVNADIVLLQEMDGGVGDRIADLRALYPHQSPCQRRCGEMILSKRPFLEDRFRVLGADGRKTAPVLLFARTTAPDGGPVTLLTLHYTWPLPGLGQEDQRRQLIDGLRFVDKHDLILAGDMNLTPWSFAMARQDAAVAPLVRQTRGLFSWPSYKAGGWRRLLPPILPIDQIYAGPAWGQVRIDRLAATGSDHYPLLVTLARR